MSWSSSVENDYVMVHLESEFAIDIETRNGPRKLDSVLSEIFLGFQAANSKVAGSKYTASGVRRPSAL